MAFSFLEYRFSFLFTFLYFANEDGSDVLGTDGRKAGWASKLKPAPLLSTKSGFTTDDIYSYFGIDMDISKGKSKSEVKRWRQKWSGMDGYVKPDFGWDP